MSVFVLPDVKSSTPIWLSPTTPLIGAIVNNTARPPGSIDGNRWSCSPRVASGLVSTLGSPPPAGTLSSPVVPSLVANTMVSSVPQVAPRGVPTNRHSISGDPPLIDTFLISPDAPSLKNPTQWLSGDMNGED